MGGGRRNFWPEDVPDLEEPHRDGERDDLRDLTQVMVTPRMIKKPPSNDLHIPPLSSLPLSLSLLLFLFRRPFSSRARDKTRGINSLS